MRYLYMCVAIVMMGLVCPLSSDAQFLKTLVNNMKQNLSNKAGNKVADSTAKAGTGSTGGTGTAGSAGANGTMDSAMYKKLLAGMNKPKSSISPADSAAAAKGFATATGGSGLQYQYLVTYTFKKKDSTFRDTMTMRITDGHEVCTDMGLFGMKTRILGHGSLPKYSVILFTGQKTYTVHIIDTASLNGSAGTTYKVVKVGNERVQGYNCVHSKLTIIQSGMKDQITEDIWTSADVPGYATLQKLAAVQGVTPKMLVAMDQAGCGGFFVKMSTPTQAFSMEMLLVEADRKTFPASLFEIPSGYTPSSGGMGLFGGMMGGH